MDIGIIGGTGKQGFGLAKRLSNFDYKIRIGSRSQEKGEKKSQELGDNVSGGDNQYAAEADVVILTIPADQIEILLEPLKTALANKIVIDTINNLTFGKSIQALDFHGTSVYEFLKAYLPQSKVLTAFKTISSQLFDSEDPLDQTDFIISPDDEAFEVVAEISKKLGLFPVKITSAYHGMTIERMVALSIQINKAYKKTHSGFIVKF